MTNLTTSPARPLGRDEIANIRARVEDAMAATPNTAVEVLVVGDQEFARPATDNGSDLDGARRVAVLDSRHHDVSQYLAEGDIHGIVDARMVGRALAPTVRAIEQGLNAAPRTCRLQIAPPALSHREWTVLRLLAWQLGNAAIATELGIEASTVKSHVASVCLKLGVKSRADARDLLSNAPDSLPEGDEVKPVHRRFRSPPGPIEIEGLRVLVVSEQRKRSEAVARALRRRFANLAEASGTAAAELDSPDVLVVEIRHHESITRSVLSWRRRLRSAALVAIVPPGRRAIRRALGVGVDGVLPGSEIEASLVSTVEAVAAGQIVVPLGAFDAEEPASPISDREEQVLRLANHGLTNDEIASKLNLAASTVKSHLSSSYRKLNVASRSEAGALLGYESRSSAEV